MMSSWADKRVLVTGGSGFLGSHLLRKLRDRGCTHIVAPGKSDYDLVEPQDVRRLLTDTRPDLIFPPVDGTALD